MIDMTSRFEITLNSVGFVVFDPKTLQDFAEKKKISGDLFQNFQDYPDVGDEIIRSGIVVPIYSIPPLDYQILITQGVQASVQTDWIKFTTEPFPLSCVSGKIIVSDIDAIMDWDYEFYNNIEPIKIKQPYNAFLLEPGKYALKIIGFCEPQLTVGVPVNKGYELLFERVKKLPAISEDVDSDSTDYIVYGEL